jgi:predicted ATP-binding protein involved in virulence
MRLKNVYGFRDLDLRFPDGPVAVLVGANGAGKSTVLDSIAMFLAPLAAMLRESDPTKAPYGLTREAIHTGAQRAHASLELEDSGRQEKWGLHADLLTVKHAVSPAMARWTLLMHRALAEGEALAVPVLCYYPAIRFYVHEGFQKRRAKSPPLLFPQLTAYDNAFEMGQRSFEDVVGWFRREEDVENERRLGGQPDYRNPRLEAVRRAVIRFMDRLSAGAFAEMRVRRDPEDASKASLLLRKGPQELSLDNLSDGERGCIVLVADLAQRLAAANPSAPDPLAGTGVVLIDEIELHLHPDWQRKIVPALTETFPGCQFIATTHSPQVLSRVPREQILLLSRFEVVEQLPYTEGRDTNAILAELMGVPRRPEDAAKEIDALARLIDEEKLPAAKRKLRALQKRFGPDDADLLRLGAMLRALEDEA